MFSQYHEDNSKDPLINNAVPSSDEEVSAFVTGDLATDTSQTTSELKNQQEAYKANLQYQYEDEDILTILEAGLIQLKMDNVYIPPCSIGNSALPMAQYLNSEKTFHAGARTLLIPYNHCHYHWVGVLIRLNDKNGIEHFIYMDSLEENPLLFAEIGHEIEKIYGPLIDSQKKTQKRFKQTGKTSCGPLTVDNLLQAVVPEDHEPILIIVIPERDETIRIKQIEWYYHNPRDRDFYNRQLNNIVKAASLIQQNKWLNEAGSHFREVELMRMVNAVELINAFNESVRRNLVRALTPLDTEMHRDHLIRTRGFLFDLFAKNQEDSNLNKLLQLMFHFTGRKPLLSAEYDNYDCHLDYEELMIIQKNISSSSHDYHLDFEIEPSVDLDESIIIERPADEKPETFSLPEIRTAQDLIKKLLESFFLIKNNLSELPGKKYNQLEMEWSQLTKTSNMNGKIEMLVDHILSWRHFISFYFLNEIQKNDIFFMDVSGNSDGIKQRYKKFSAVFHPDKNTNHANKIWSEKLSTEIMTLLNTYKKNNPDHINSCHEMKQGQEHVQRYHEYKNSALPCFQESANNQLLSAINSFKQVIASATKKEDLEDESVLVMQINARMQISDCYKYLDKYLPAQIYIVSALRIAQCSEQLQERKRIMEDLQHRLQALKNNVVQPEKKAVTVEKEEYIVPDHNSERSLTAMPKFSLKGEIADICLSLTALPDKPLAGYKIAPDELKRVEVYSKSHYAAAVVVGVVSLGTTAAPIWGAFALAAAHTALLGPIGLIIGGTALIAAGIYGGYRVFKKGMEIAEIVDIRTELNDAIDDALALYVKGRYLNFIERLSGCRYFKYGKPLIYYNRSNEGLPVEVKRTEAENSVDLVETLLENGFRADGIAFLLNVIAEVVLANRIEHRSSAMMSIYGALRIFREVLDNEKLMASAEALDINLSKEKKSREENEENLFSNMRKEFKEFREGYYAVQGNFSQVTSDVYIKDYIEMPITLRLKEQQMIAKINYAICLVMAGHDRDLTLAAESIREVKSHYENYDKSKSSYITLIDERFELISELIFAFGIEPENSKALTEDNNELREARSLHDEVCMARQELVKNVYMEKIATCLEQLEQSGQTDKKIFALLVLDKLRIDVSCRHWEEVVRLLSLLNQSLKKPNYDLDASFYQGWETIIGIYANAFERKNSVPAKALTEMLSALPVEGIIKASRILEGMLSEEIRQSDSLATYRNPEFSDSKTGLSQGLKMVFENTADAFISTIIVFSFKDMAKTPVEQFKFIHENGFDQAEDLLQGWKACFPLSYKYHSVSLDQQLQEWLHTDNNESMGILYIVICTKLQKLSDHLRNEIFKKILTEEEKLKKSSPSCYLRAQERISNHFSKDLEIYRINHMKKFNARLHGGNIELKNIAMQLNKRVIGQPDAADMLSNAILGIHRSIVPQKSPVFLNCGPTGTGKTELAKAAACLIGKEKTNPHDSAERMVSFKMEHYAAEHSGSSLFGSPAGYVGSTDKPIFAKDVEPFVISTVNGVKTVKYLVLLFDELEKAHSKVKQSLLGLFDECKIDITYTHGKENVKITYVFLDCIFVCTSNLFSQHIAADFSKNMPIGQVIKNFHTRLNNNQHLPEIFSPELAGRMRILPFRPIRKGEDFQAVIKKTLLLIDYETRKSHGISVEMAAGDILNILITLENEHYDGGVGIRALYDNIKTLFDKFIHSLDIGLLLENDARIVLKYDPESQKVILNIVFDHFGIETRIDQNEQGEKFYLSDVSIRSGATCKK